MTAALAPAADLSSGGMRVSGLTVSYGGTPMIGPVSFEVPAGASVTIVGETGAGKTLLLRSLMGLLPAGFDMAGEVYLSDAGSPLRTAAELRAQLGRHVGVVLQNPFRAFDPLRPVGRQVTEGVLRRNRRYSVARRLAGLFASYAVQRPALVADWSAGRDTDGLGGPLDPDLAWQPELWRRLVDRVGESAPEVRHAETVARLRDNLLSATQATGK